MHASSTRRTFLRTAVASGALAGLGDLGFLRRLPLVSASEARLAPSVVRLEPDIEPLVELLEQTPREDLLEVVAGRIRGGLGYQELLAALLLAGVRNVQPRPSVGFKFHCVLVVNSAHLASLASPDEHRWLPIFWALDYFKSAQAQDTREGHWTMPAVDDSAVPRGADARAAFVKAMDSWDEEAADVATAGLVRSTGANDMFELFARYGARDFRDIGHKAIFVANGWRTLDCIGWRHAEPVLRSLAYALQHHGGANPAQSDDPADRPWRRGESQAASFRADWTTGNVDDAATRDLLGALRENSDQDCVAAAVETINRGAAPQAIWDAVFLGAGELLMRQPGIVALHALTSTNALHYAYQVSGNDETRRRLLLQNVAFVPLFRDAMKSRGDVGDARIDEFEPASGSADAVSAAGEIFAAVSSDRMDAARRALAFLDAGGDPTDFVDAGRTLVFLKGSNSHDYKFSSAVMEDYAHVSPKWRNRFLAASVFNLRGSGDADNELVARTRSALRA